MSQIRSAKVPARIVAKNHETVMMWRRKCLKYYKAHISIQQWIHILNSHNIYFPISLFYRSILEIYQGLATNIKFKSSFQQN